MAADAFSCSAFSSCRVSLIRSVFVLMSVQRKCEISSSEVVFFLKLVSLQVLSSILATGPHLMEIQNS